MAMEEVLAVIDAQISKLQQARAVLEDKSEAPVAAKKAGRGRPKGSKNTAGIAAPATPAAPAKKKGKRQLSPEGRKAIADAMKRRWAEKRSSK